MRRSGLSHARPRQEPQGTGSTLPHLETSHPGSANGNGLGQADADELHAALPGTLEYWTDPGRSGPTPFRYLTALRQSPPGIKNFG